MAHKHVFTKFAICDICDKTLEEIENERNFKEELKKFSIKETTGKPISDI